MRDTMVSFALFVSLLILFLALPIWGITATVKSNNERNAKHTAKCERAGGIVLQLDRQKVCSVPEKGLVDSW